MNTPQWLDKPNQPGLWLLDCVTKKPSLRWSAMLLTQDDLDRGAPFGVARVFGPVAVMEEENTHGE